MSSSRDLISGLPDEILGKILSLLWTNRAACTSVLSKRWRNLLSFVDNLDLHDGSCGSPFFCDFVDQKLALLSNSPTFKRFSLDLTYNHEDSRVNNWIRTALEHGCLELHLNDIRRHRIDTEFFTSNKLVELTICNGIYPARPLGTVNFPALKSLSLLSLEFEDANMYEDFISCCPVLEELMLDYDADGVFPAWNGVVSIPSIKRLTIIHNFPKYHEDINSGCRLETPNLVYLDYSSYVATQYEVDLASLIEARLDLLPWDRTVYEDWSDREEESDTEDDFGDVTDLVAGICNVKTLHLSPDSLEVFHLCCDTLPMFHNLITLSFESHKEKGWQVLPLLLNNSPNLKTLIIKGLVHKVTDKCGDACACSLMIRKKKKKKMKMEERVCCLSTCRVKFLNISRYRGTCRELKQMRHFLGNLKCLETVNVSVKVNHREDKERIINALMKLPKVSSNCQIQLFHSKYIH